MFDASDVDVIIKVVEIWVRSSQMERRVSDHGECADEWVGKGED